MSETFQNTTEPSLQKTQAVKLNWGELMTLGQSVVKLMTLGQSVVKLMTLGQSVVKHADKNMLGFDRFSEKKTESSFMSRS